MNLALMPKPFCGLQLKMMKNSIIWLMKFVLLLFQKMNDWMMPKKPVRAMAESRVRPIIGAIFSGAL